VLAEDSSKYFNTDCHSPYMLIVADVREERRKPVPADYYSMELMQRLYVPRSDLQSITHLDFSARIQSVHRETNPRYYALLQKMKEKTGYGIVVNTSFNVRGEPIVCTPEDAYRCFMRTEMDYLVINNYLFEKSKQPKWKESDDWKKEFVLD
jgi:carbamoyltransferase